MIHFANGLNLISHIAKMGLTEVSIAWPAVVSRVLAYLVRLLNVPAISLWLPDLLLNFSFSTGADQHGIDAELLRARERLISLLFVPEGTELYACFEMGFHAGAMQLFLQSLGVSWRGKDANLDHVVFARYQHRFFRGNSVRHRRGRGGGSARWGCQRFVIDHSGRGWRGYSG